MKKMIICSILLISVFAVSAQQGPSFRDYLRNSQGSPVISKPFVSTIPLVKKFGNSVNEQELMLGNGMTLKDAKLVGILPNGNKLYKLPLDKMVCVVPDISQFHMPVAKGDNSLDKKINALDTE